MVPEVGLEPTLSFGARRQSRRAHVARPRVVTDSIEVRPRAGRRPLPNPIAWRRRHGTHLRVLFSDSMSTRTASLLFACALLSVAGSCSDAALAQDPPAAKRWEYGVLSHAENILSDRFVWAWSERGKNVERPSLLEFAKELSGEPDGSSFPVRILNALGADGWELVSYACAEKDEFWYLKRPAR